MFSEFMNNGKKAEQRERERDDISNSDIDYENIIKEILTFRTNIL